MEKRFYSKGAKIHFFTCLVTLVVTVGILLVNWMTNDNSAPRNPDKVKLEKSATLRVRVDNEDVEVHVKKGSEIKILGVRKGTMLIPERVWVELEDGSRGYIYCTDFDLEYTALVKDEKAPIPVKVKGLEKDKMVCEFEDGTVKNLHCDDVIPQWPDSWDFEYLSTGTYSSYMSKEKFERKYIGSTLEENDKRMVPARYVVRKGNQTYAFYPMYILNTTNGMRYTPTVVYDESGKATSYINEDSKKRAKFFLKTMPLVGATVDNPFCHSLIQGSMYDLLPATKNNPTIVKKILGWLVMVVYLVFVIIWFYVTPMIPVLLIGVLMHYRKVFYFLSNRVLSVLMLTLTVVCTYLWGVLLLGWGIMWLFLLPLPFVALFFYGFASAPLDPYIPSGRCVSCRRIESMKFVDSVYDHEYKQWSQEKEFARTLKSKTHRWQTWTQITRTYSDGRKSSWKENVQDHKSTTETNLFNDYNVLYNVSVYKNNYSCCVCGQHEHNMSNKYTELERKYQGSHTETRTY